MNEMSKEIEISLFKDLAQIIEQGKRQAVTQVKGVLQWLHALYEKRIKYIN